MNTAPAPLNNVHEEEAIALFSELFMIDQLARSRISKVLPKGMELSHLSVLNHLSSIYTERTPAQLAKVFHVTRAAMTNTLSRLEKAGYIHIRPDWDDARRKLVFISTAGRAAQKAAVLAVLPVIRDIVESLGVERTRAGVSMLRDVRKALGATLELRPNRAKPKSNMQEHMKT